VGDLQALAIEVKRRLDAGRTPPPSWYTDPALYAAERELVFGRTWQLACTTEDFRRGARSMPVTVGDREFVITRTDNDVFHAFHNVCSHRAFRVAEEVTSRQLLRCRYHGWTYDLSGVPRAAPGLDRAADFDPAEYCLKPASVGRWGPVLFINPDAHPSTALPDYLGDMVDRMRAIGLDLGELDQRHKSRHAVRLLACNWKIAVENGLECYHCASTHRRLAATADLSRHELVAIRVNRVVDRLPLRSTPPADGRGMAPTVWSAAGEAGAITFNSADWLFPNQSIAVWPGPGNSVTVNRWLPQGLEHTRWELLRWWAADTPDDVIDDQWQFVVQNADEDQVIVEGVQSGVRSGAWSGGRYQLETTGRSELGPRAFNQMLLKCLCEDPVNWSKPEPWEVRGG
jgi:choline monooxygenase